MAATQKKQITYRISALTTHCARDVTTPREAEAFIERLAAIKAQSFRITDRWGRQYRLGYATGAAEFVRCA